VSVSLRVSNPCQLITCVREPPWSDVNFVTAKLFCVQRAAWLTPIQWNGRSDGSWNFIGTSEWEIFRWNVEAKITLIEKRIKIVQWIGAREPFDTFLSQKCLNYVPKNMFFSAQHLVKKKYLAMYWPPLWFNGQSFWLQIQGSRVRFQALPDFLSSSGSGTGSTQPREDNWGATWKK
jgi:hypothetical protein